MVKVPEMDIDLIIPTEVNPATERITEVHPEHYPREDRVSHKMEEKHTSISKMRAMRIKLKKD